MTKDVELGGQQLSRGDFLILSWLSANFDEKVFDRPDEVILDRSPNPHMAFGVGPHRCIGMHIARSLFEVMMPRGAHPDSRLRGRPRARRGFYKGNPELAGVVTMPVTFTPGDAGRAWRGRSEAAQERLGRGVSRRQVVRQAPGRPAGGGLRRRCRSP